MFSQVDDAVILEDDCLSDLSFFDYCQALCAVSAMTYGTSVEYFFERKLCGASFPPSYLELKYVSLQCPFMSHRFLEGE